MASSGPHNGAGFVNVAGGFAEWTNPNAAELSGDNYAFAIFAAFPDDFFSDTLRVTGFVGAVPVGATVIGIEFSVERHKSLSSSCVDYEVYALKAVGRVGSNLASAAEWPTPLDATATYGDPTNLLGTTWTAAEVNADLGIEISIVVGAGGQGGFIDHITATIYYTPAAAAATPADNARSTVESNIRLLMDDRNPSAYVVSSEQLHRIVNQQMQVISSRTFLSLEQVRTVPLVEGTSDYTLTGIVGDVRRIVRDSDGGVLDDLPLEVLNALYGADTVSPDTGTPTHYALLETSAQASRIRVGPTPEVSGTLDVYYGIIPANLTSDDATIPFSDVLLRSLERACAAECVNAMTPEQRARRMISAESVPIWRQMAEAGIRDENFRLRMMGGGTQGRIVETDT